MNFKGDLSEAQVLLKSVALDPRYTTTFNTSNISLAGLFDSFDAIPELGIPDHTVFLGDFGQCTNIDFKNTALAHIVREYSFNSKNFNIGFGKSHEYANSFSGSRIGGGEIISGKESLGIRAFTFGLKNTPILFDVDYNNQTINVRN